MNKKGLTRGNQEYRRWLQMEEGFGEEQGKKRRGKGDGGRGCWGGGGGGGGVFV
jgi:hypothetical protein